jgi:hypothetical protein
MNRQTFADHYHGMNPIWRYEIRRCGRGALAMPVAVGLVIGAARTVSLDDLVVHLTAINAVPVVSGLVAATALGEDTMRELRLTLASPYTHAVLRRTALVVGSAGCGALSLVLSPGNGTWPPTDELLVRNAILAIALISVAAFAVAYLRSVAGASTVVATAWLAKLLILDQFARPLAVQAPLFLIGGAILAWLSAIRIVDNESPI